MLGKLLKYDYRSNLFYFLLMYAVLIGISVLARTSIIMTDFEYSVFQNDVLSGMAVVGAVVLYFLACGAMIIMTFLLIALRFYRNLMGSEGYLSFTLPVTPGTHVASKMISGVSLVILSYLVLLLSGVIVTGGTGLWSGSVLWFAKIFITTIKMDNLGVMALYVLNGLTGMIQTVAMIYFAVCVGQTAHRHRVLAAIGIFIASVIVLGIISGLGGTILLTVFQNSMGSVLYYVVTNLVTILYHGLVTVGALIGAICLIRYRLNLE